MPEMTVAELEEFFAAQFPQMEPLPFKIVRLEGDSIEVRWRYHERHLRPGGTISGPTMMMLADMAMYVMVLAAIGPVALAVTTNLNINFLRKPMPGDIIARGRMLKLGSRLAVGEIGLYSDGEDEPVAHATVTYSIPPRSVHTQE